MCNSVEGARRAGGLLLAVLLAAACGSSDAGEPVRPPGAEVAGTWIVEVALSGTCDYFELPERIEDLAEVTQDGSRLTVSFQSSLGTVSAILSATDVRVDGPVSFQGNELRVSFDGTTTGAGDAVHGSANWQLPIDPAACHGTAEVSARRLPEPTADFSGVWVGPLWTVDGARFGELLIAVEQDGPRVSVGYGLTLADSSWGMQCLGFGGYVDADRLTGIEPGIFSSWEASPGPDGALLGTFSTRDGTTGTLELVPTPMGESLVTAEFPSPVPGASGVASDGVDLWLSACDDSGCALHRVSLQGEVLETIALDLPEIPGMPARPSIADLTCDGSTFWLVDEMRSVVIQVSRAGELLAQWDSPIDMPNAVAVDRTGLWLASPMDDWTVQVDFTGSVTATHRSLGSSRSGLAYDGEGFWFADDQCLQSEVHPEVPRFVVFRFDADTDVTAMVGYPGDQETGPEGLAYDGEQLWALDAAGGALRLLRFEAATAAP